MQLMLSKRFALTLILERKTTVCVVVFLVSSLPYSPFVRYLLQY